MLRGVRRALFGAAASVYALSARAEPQPIYGGAKVQPCAWPTTVALGGCTGTLVHPQVVVFAAHCMQGSWGPDSVTFGDNENSPAFSVATTGCDSDPQYYSASGHDVAFCKLAQPVTSVPIVPILVGCETNVLTPGASVVAVGFGEADDGLGWGPKRAVAMQLNGVSNGEAFIGGGGKDTCYGDSGGPVYIQLADQSWRVFGITSYGEYCGGGGYYSMMHTAIDWLEQSTGIDLTPCHDQGQWLAGPECGGFPLDPNVGGAAWSQGCATGNASGPSATCGPAYGGGTTGGSGGTGGTGGRGSGGGGGANPRTGGTGGSSAPPNDCSTAFDCLSQCTCLTQDPDACVLACKPTGSGSDTANPPSGAAPSRSSDDSSGCVLAGRRMDHSWIIAGVLFALIHRRARKGARSCT
jgi:hypothetical protein